MVGAVPVGAGLVAHLREHVVDQFFAEGSGHTDGLGIDGVAALTHTVTGFAPPVVRGDAETVDGDALVHHQSHLFFWGQHAQQVFHTFCPGQLGVLPGKFLLRRDAHSGQSDG